MGKSRIPNFEPVRKYINKWVRIMIPYKFTTSSYTSPKIRGAATRDATEVLECVTIATEPFSSVYVVFHFIWPVIFLAPRLIIDI